MSAAWRSGFGAQSLVKDFLSGIFMILEDQYGVGDVIDTGEAIGTVEEVTLRVTRLRDASGVVWYIRNGEIVRIGNKSQGWSTAIVDIPVAYAENIERVIPLIRDVVTSHGRDAGVEGAPLEEPQVVGVESIDRHGGDGADHRQDRGRAAVRRLRARSASASRPPSTRRASRAPAPRPNGPLTACGR